MKQLLIICLVLLQFAGLSPAKAGTATPFRSAIQIGQASTGHHDHPAVVSKPAHVSSIPLKARHHRIGSSALCFDDDANILNVVARQDLTEYSSPLYLPLIRLLLYPKHYFW